jgi:hypothetical protein
MVLHTIFENVPTNSVIRQCDIPEISNSHLSHLFFGNTHAPKPTIRAIRLGRPLLSRSLLHSDVRKRNKLLNSSAINLAKRNLTMNFDTPSRGVPEVIFILPANERVVECSRHPRGQFDCSECSRRRDRQIGRVSRSRKGSTDMTPSGHKRLASSGCLSLLNATNQSCRESGSTSDVDQGQNRSSGADVVVTKSVLYDGSDSEKSSGNNILRRSGSEGMMSLSNVAGLISKMLEDAIDQGALSMSKQSLPSKEMVTTTDDQIPDQHLSS